MACCAKWRPALSPSTLGHRKWEGGRVAGNGLPSAAAGRGPRELPGGGLGAPPAPPQAAQTRDARGGKGRQSPVSCLMRPFVQAAFRKQWGETEAWNGRFWSEHNAAFQKVPIGRPLGGPGRWRRAGGWQGKAEWAAKAGRTVMSPDEAAVYYKAFLDQRWPQLWAYNWCRLAPFPAPPTPSLLSLKGLVPTQFRPRPARRSRRPHPLTPQTPILATVSYLLV